MTAAARPAGRYGKGPGGGTERRGLTRLAELTWRPCALGFGVAQGAHRGYSAGRSGEESKMKRIVWGRATSSNVMKVLWGLGELGLEFERIDVGGAFGKTDTPEYRGM